MKNLHDTRKKKALEIIYPKKNVKMDSEFFNKWKWYILAGVIILVLIILTVVWFARRGSSSTSTSTTTTTTTTTTTASPTTTTTKPYEYKVITETLTSSLTTLFPGTSSSSSSSSTSSSTTTKKKKPVPKKTPTTKTTTTITTTTTKKPIPPKPPVPPPKPPVPPPKPPNPPNPEPPVPAGGNWIRGLKITFYCALGDGMCGEPQCGGGAVQDRCVAAYPASRDGEFNHKCDKTLVIRFDGREVSAPIRDRNTAGEYEHHFDISSKCFDEWGIKMDNYEGLEYKIV